MKQVWGKPLKGVVTTHHMSDESSSEICSDGSRIVKISRNGEEALGAAFFLTATQLSRLGINPKDAKLIALHLHDGRIEVSVHESSEQDRLRHSSD